jgi:hypothetical protein
MVEPVNTQATATEPHNGVTLLDLVLAISGSWAIPQAVISVLGRDSRWLVLAFVATAATCIPWVWYCRKLIRAMGGALFGGRPHPPSVAAGVGVYLAVLAISLLLQFAIFRGLQFALRATLHA